LALGVLNGDLLDDAEAAGAFKQATRVFPADPRGWAGLGGALFMLGRFSEAAVAYAEADRLITPSASAEHRAHANDVKGNLATTLALLGRSTEGLKALRAVANIAEHPRLLVLLGHLLLMDGQRRPARKAFDQALSKAPTDTVTSAELFVDLADGYRILQDGAKELSSLVKALAARPGRADTYRRLAAHYAAAGDLSAAERYLRSSLHKDPQSIAARSELALLLASDDRADEAAEEARTCLTGEPRSALDHYYAGLAFHVLGDEASATVERGLSRRDSRIARWPEYGALRSQRRD
jgi:Flp pilus assembly protein TadD